MATSHPVETPVESDVDIDEAVKQILAEMEAEEQDPLEGMGNAQVAKIYNRMTPEDQRLFRQFKRFHKRYYETHGHDAPSHQLTRGIVQHMFPGLPSADAETIAKARAERWLQKESRSCANSWDWQSQLNCSRTHHGRRHLNIRHHQNHHDSCQGKRRSGWLNSRRRKRLISNRTSSLGDWPPRI